MSSPLYNSLMVDCVRAGHRSAMVGGRQVFVSLGSLAAALGPPLILLLGEPARHAPALAEADSWRGRSGFRVTVFVARAFQGAGFAVATILAACPAAILWGICALAAATAIFFAVAGPGRRRAGEDSISMAGGTG